MRATGSRAGIVEGGRGLCWGFNDEGQLGTGSSLIASFASSPHVVSDDLRFRELSTKAAGRHVCGVTTVGDAYCWGENYFGQIGNGSTTFVARPPTGGGRAEVCVDQRGLAV